MVDSMNDIERLDQRCDVLMAILGATIVESGILTRQQLIDLLKSGKPSPEHWTQALKDLREAKK